MNTTGARPLAFACSTCRVSRSMTPTKGFSFPRATPGQPRVCELRQYDRQDIATHTGPQEPGSRAAAVHRGREGPHGAVAIANASFKRQRQNHAVTEIERIPNRGHSLTIDSGWREVAERALAFVKRFV
jgi:hypothetical protein